MAVTIADLDVNIRTTGGGAASALEELISKLDQLIAALNGTSTSGKGATSTIRSMGSSLKSAGSSAQYANTGLLGFFRQVKRIATYRLIRTALRGIINGFREGIQNIAQYSAAMNGLDANKANSVMSSYATMGAQIKNSLGAAIMPMLASLLPTIQKLADGFMDVADAAARFFATLNGQATYTAVNRDYMVDYAASLNKANQSAKELKNTILGFDEINALQKQSSGNSSNAIDYSQMFVEAENDWLGLKEKFEWGLVTVEAIGAALLTWRISAGLLTSLESGMTLAMGIKNALLGIAGMVISIVFGIKAGAAFAEGDIKGGLAKAILSTLGGALGGAYLGSFAGGKGMLIGALVGVGVSLVVTIGSYLANKQTEDNRKRFREVTTPLLRELGLNPDDYSESGIQATIDVAISLKQRIADITTDISADAQAKFEKAQNLIDTIFSTSQTEENLAMIKKYVEELNALGLEGINIKVKDDGTLSKTKEELQGILDKLIEVEKAQALSNARTEAWNGLIEAKLDYEKAVRKEADIYNAYQEAWKNGASQEELQGILERFYNAQTARKTAGSTFNAAKQKYADIYNESGFGDVVKSTKYLVSLASDVREYLDKGVEANQKGFNYLGIITDEEYWITEFRKSKDDLANTFQEVVSSGVQNGVYSSKTTTQEVFSDAFAKAFSAAWDGSKATLQNALERVFNSAVQMGVSGVEFTDFKNRLDEITKDIMKSEGLSFADAVKKALPQALNEAFGEADFTTFSKKLIDEVRKYNPQLADELAEALFGAIKKTLTKTQFEIDFIKTFNKGKDSDPFTGFTITPYATGGFVPSGDLFWAGERGAEIITTAPGGSEVINEAQFERMVMNAVAMAGGGGGGDWTIVVQDESGNERSRQVITAAERANRRDGRTIIPVGVS